MEKSNLNRKLTANQIAHADQSRLEFLDQILNSINDGIFTLDHGFKITYFNRAAEKLLGRPAKAVLGKHIFREAFPEAAGSIFEEKYREALKSNKNLQFETIFKGESFENWYDVKVFPNSYGIMVCFTVTTERKKTETTLRDNEEKYRRIVETSNEGIWSIDADKVTTFVNKTITEVLGYTSSEMIGRRLYDFMFSEDIPDHEKRIQKRRKGLKQNYVIKLKHKDGHPIYMFASATPILDESGKFQGSFAMLTDITERRRAEEALLTSEQRLNDIIEGNPIATIVVDKNHIVTHWNNACEILCNTKREEIIGTNRHWVPFYDKPRPLFADLIIDESPEEMIESCYESSYRKSGLIDGAYEAVKYYPHLGQSGLWIHIFTAPIKDSSGSIIGAIETLQDVTDQREAENVIRRERDNSIRILNGSPSIVCRIAPDGTTLYANPATEKITGYKIEEILGKNWWDKFYPGETKELADGLLKKLDRGNVSRREMTMTIKGGAKRIISWSSVNRFDDNDKLIEIIGFGSDITERKEAERALIESEARYRKLFDTANDAIFLMQQDRFIDCNNKTLQMFNCSPEQILHRPPYEFSPEYQPDGMTSRDKALMYINEALHGKPQFFEWKHKRYDGEEFFAEVSLNSLELSDEIYLLAVVRDISERKRRSESLRRSQQAYSSLAENSSDVISRIDRNYRYLYVNTVVEKYTGLPAAEYIGKTVRDFDFEEEFCDFWKESLEKVFLSGRPFETQFNLEFNGQTVIFDWRLNPEFAADGSVESVLSIARDITETIRLKDLESRAKRLETAGQIAGQVAHDFNNLLAPLMAYPDFIRMELPPDNRAHKYINDIENAAGQIADINQQLLTLGRRGHYNLEPLNLNSVVNEVLAHMEPPPSSLVLDISLDEDLMNIRGGRAQIYRVMSNLVHNARDAMTDIGTLTVRTENYYMEKNSGNYNRIPKGEYVKITVSDTGAGIAEENLQKIFDPFFTTKTTDKKRGSGLGLSVVDAVVKDHEGYIDVESRLGCGTSMYVYFNITRENVEEQNDGPIPGGDEAILVVDDDAIQREVTTSLLTRLGYRVEAVDSGEKAVALLKTESFDLLVLDMIMPGGIDGAETFKRARAIDENQKAVIVSGFSESARVRQALNLGAGGYIRKPLNLKSISRAVRSELDRKQSVNNPG